VSDDREDSSAAYIPARYKERIQSKKRQRLIKKLALYGGIGILVILVLILGTPFIFPPGSPAPSGNISPALTTTSIPEQPGTQLPTPDTTGTPVALESSPVMEPVNISVTASPDTAGISSIPPIVIDSVRLDFPATEFTIVSANETSRYSGKNLYEIKVQPAENIGADTGFTVFYNAIDGEPYTPGEDKLAITPAKAREIAGSAFQSFHPDKIRLHYSDGSWGIRGWNFNLIKDDTVFLEGTIDADTGEIIRFSRSVSSEGRATSPVLDIKTAQAYADRYIADHNNPVDISLRDSQYISAGSATEPVAGSFSYTYDRMVQGYPCDQDGFVVTVNSVTGEITGYNKTWNDPDFAFILASEPVVLKRDAIYSVLHKAQEIKPGEDTGLQVISSELVWKDLHKQGTTPRPGSIPLAWKIMFDDESLRNLPSPKEAVGWVDPQTGSIMELEYPL